MSPSGFFGHKEQRDQCSLKIALIAMHMLDIFTHSHIPNCWPFFKQQNTRSKEALGDLPSNGDCISRSRKVVCGGQKRALGSECSRRCKVGLPLDIPSGDVLSLLPSSVLTYVGDSKYFTSGDSLTLWHIQRRLSLDISEEFQNIINILFLQSR
jgi:hypothetical protein